MYTSNKIILSIYLFFVVSLPAFSQASRPNFVIIIGDDISWNDLGSYGNPTVKSPHIDQLAREGMKFTNVYLTASSCSPSRSSIISGRYPHNTGAAELHTPLTEGMVTLAGQLRKNGYYTAASGKWHLGPYAKTDFDLVVEENIGPGGEEQWIPVLKNRPWNMPFFLWLAALDAHRQWQPDPEATPHDPATVALPPYLADAPDTRQDLASYYDEIQRFDRYVGMVRSELAAQGELENTLLIVMADNGRPFPRCKTRVYDSGMKTPFIIYWPKGLQKAGADSEALVSVIDIAPTFLELAGIAFPPSLQGISFVPVIKNSATKHRKYAFAEHNWHDFEAHERMVRDQRFLYVVNNRPDLPALGPADSNNSPTFTDLTILRKQGRLNAAQADVFMAPRPYPRYYEVLNQLREIMNRWIQETGDDVPVNLTPSKYDPVTGKQIVDSGVRGTMPGSTTDAISNNNKGPY